MAGDRARQVWRIGLFAFGGLGISVGIVEDLYSWPNASCRTQLPLLPRRHNRDSDRYDAKAGTLLRKPFRLLQCTGRPRNQPVSLIVAYLGDTSLAPRRVSYAPCSQIELALNS
jgi:hypothetical protein